MPGESHEQAMPFERNQPASWIAQMELCTEHRRVLDRYKVTVAASYLDERTMNWYTIALGREEQPKDWGDF